MIKITKADCMDEFYDYIKDEVGYKELVDAIIYKEADDMREKLLLALDNFERELLDSNYIIV